MFFRSKEADETALGTGSKPKQPRRSKQRKTWC